MPMAGEGRRFIDKGIFTPKPLIEVGGKPLFLRSVSSLSGINCQKKYSLIVRQEHIDGYRIEEKMKKYLPEAVIIPVLKTTRGAVETCLLAKDNISPDEAVLILDCDLEFSSPGFDKIISEILQKEVNNVDGGALVSFKSSNARYSYALLNEEGLVTQTAEKIPISDNALAGAYFFSKSQGFLYPAELLMREAGQRKTELYVSLLYNFLIKNGEKIRLARTVTYNSFGTPEEISHNEALL